MTSEVLNDEEVLREPSIGERVGTIARKRIKRKVMRQRGSGVVDKTDYPKTSSGSVGRWRRRDLVATRLASPGSAESRATKNETARDPRRCLNNPFP